MAAMTALAIGSIAASAIGTGVQVMGQRKQAKAAERAGEQNAANAEMDALQTTLDTNEAVRRQRERNKATSSTQRSKYAKAGVVMEGTPLEVLAESAGLMELDALEQGRTGRAKSKRLREGGSQARQDGYDRGAGYRTAAGATLLSGLGSAAGSIYDLKKG